MKLAVGARKGLFKLGTAIGLEVNLSLEDDGVSYRLQVPESELTLGVFIYLADDYNGPGIGKILTDPDNYYFISQIVDYRIKLRDGKSKLKQGYVLEELLPRFKSAIEGLNSFGGSSLIEDTYFKLCSYLR